jgi:uncharacterized protein YbjT (DUF2867 family)
MLLIVGATGTNGREILGRLAGAGQPARAMVRNPAKAGDLRGPNVEVVAGDLDDPDSLDAALAGVERAFFLASVDRRYSGWFRNFLNAARRDGVRHLVKFSGFGAGVDSPAEIMRQHGETDDALLASGLAYTILRPNSFHQNLLWSAGTIKDQGAFYLPIRDGKQSLVDVRDIADVAVHVLTEAEHENRIYEITGPQSLSYHDVAATLSAVLGRTIRYVDVPPETALDAMLQSGMPEWNAKALIDLYSVFAAGGMARTADVVERITGHAPRSFEQFARDHAEAFR